VDRIGARLAAGGVVLLDGATGTELQRRGVPMHGGAWSATAVLTHPEVVRAVHGDHARAGADVITANTFAAGRLFLDRSGLGGRTSEINRLAVDLARQAAAAAGRPVAVAGSINLWDPPPREAEVRASLVEQAGLLAEAGVDLLLLEMMERVEDGVLALEAARGTGLPVWMGCSVRAAADGSVALRGRGEPLAAALEAWLPLGAAAYLVMHSLPGEIAPALRVLGERWRGPSGAYAHMGEFTMPHWRWVDMKSPEEYADVAEGWVATGARIVGGCCGLGPEYTAALARRFRGGERG
jgi:S-methylmethionine-dependent homocysteine/selenocysteine methylase